MTVALPDSFMRLHQHCAVGAGEGHGVVAHVDLAAAQQHLAADLQAFIQDGQQEDADAGRHHLWLDPNRRREDQRPHIKATRKN